MVILAGMLDEDSSIKPKHNIFFKNKVLWYYNADKLIEFDGLPIKWAKRLNGDNKTMSFSEKC